MGDVLAYRRFSPEKTEGLLKPIIFCCPCPGIEEQAISLNKSLSSALIRIKPNRRTMQIENCFLEVLGGLPKHPIIKNYEVMFHPDYKVDVLGIMVSACKKKPFWALWPGRYEDGKLIYAEESFSDYKVFNVQTYDITCVV